jgi:hypothetical protein
MHRSFGVAGLIAAVGLFTASLVVDAPAAHAAELTSAQKQYLAGAKKSLAQLQANLKLATDTAGPGDGVPPASKAKLAGARLQAARQSAANVGAYLDKLPADDADVKAVRGDYDDAMKAVDALAERLAGTSNDAAKPGPAKGDAAPLDYRAEQAFKIARSNVDAVVASADKLDKIVAEIKAAKQKSAVSDDALSAAMGSIQSAGRQAGYADDQFKKLPAEHPTVKAAADELKAAVARVDAAEKAIEPLSKASAKAGDGGSYPELQADITRLNELAAMLGTGVLSAVDRTPAAELARQLPALKEEGDRLLKKYEPLLSKNTDASRNLQANAKRLSYQVGKFEEALAREKQALPKQIETDMAQAAKLAERAVKEQKPAFFRGGVADNLRFAENKLVLYEALDTTGAAKLKEKLEQTREAVKKQEASLAGAIVEANPLPPDTYAGADKAGLIQRATDAVKKQNPKAEVLAVRIPKSQWERETKWRYENREWRKIDRSRLQAQVIVKRDDKIAEIRPVNLWTDHTNNDAISATPLFGEKEELSPGDLLPIAKVK